MSVITHYKSVMATHPSTPLQLVSLLGNFRKFWYQASWAERLMIQLATVVAQTRVVHGGRHRAIRCHCMVFNASGGPAALCLPRPLDEDSMYRVILAGRVTDTQRHHVRHRLHEVREATVRRLLRFYARNNHLYGGVAVDWDAVNRIDTNRAEFVRDRIFVEELDILTTTISDRIERDQESIVSNADNERPCTEAEECVVLERNVIFIPEEEAPLLPDVLPSGKPIFKVYHSTNFGADDDGYWMLKCMPTSSRPYGRGHPAEKRKVHVSRRDCVRYYSLLSSRRFAQDKTYMLTAFDRLAMQKMNIHTSITCLRTPAVFEDYHKISSSDLHRALLDKELRRRGAATTNSAT